MIRQYLLGAALALAVGSGAVAPAGEDVVKIGVMAPVTGAWAAEGDGMVNTVRILADNLNAAGGAGGRTVEIIVADDGGDPRTAALAAQRLVAAGVVAVIGTYGSAVTQASQGIYHEDEVIQIATGSTSVNLTERKMPLFFRTCPRDDDQGRVMVEQVAKLGFKRVAVVHDNSAYARGLAEESRALFAKDQAIEIALFEAITPGERDYAAALVKIKNANPDVIVFTGYYPEAAMLLRQKTAMKWDVPMIGGDATNNAKLIDIAGVDAAKGFMFISPPGPLDLKGEAAEKYLAEYRAKHNGAVPGSVWAVLAGDAFNVLAEALANVPGRPNAKKLGAYLHNDLKDFNGFTGPIAFNAKGDRVGDLYRLYRVADDGRFALQD